MVTNAPLQELTATPTWQLTALDRCDGCGAQAYYRATLHSGGVLLFCHHHGQQHVKALSPSVKDWLDESARLGEL